MNKREILNTIKSMTEENGGQPPGWQVFQSATGIREGDWRPRYWLRWGDALKEAGYQPNTFQKAYDRKILVEKLIELSRELGHFPLSGELTRKRKADSTFPSRSVFQNWGNKSFLAEQVLAHCKSCPGYEDVALMCSEVLNEATTDVDESSTHTTSIGYVYLFRHGSRNEYKIGRTNNPMRREGEFRTEFPEQLQPIHTIKTDDPAGIERYWHQRFQDKRMQGEWFSLSQDDVRAFKKWKRIA